MKLKDYQNFSHKVGDSILAYDSRLFIDDIKTPSSITWISATLIKLPYEAHVHYCEPSIFDDDHINSEPDHKYCQDYTNILVIVKFDRDQKLVKLFPWAVKTKGELK